MSDENSQQWQHDHNFSFNNDQGEKHTRYVLILTAITMVVEIIAGSIYGSMALLADGWHMGTHVAAFLIALFTYHYARKHADNPEFSFGTGKVNVLGGFASAVALAVVALVMLVESVQRFFAPEVIHFNEAIVVAVIGLTVNIVSAFLLKDSHSHDHGHHPSHDHHNHHQDHNLRAAYLHVLADAMTSVLAIIALLTGKYFRWLWLDPVMGIVGAVIITRWSLGLLKQTSPILLDASIEEQYRHAIRSAIENEADSSVFDLHVWKVSADHYAAIVALSTTQPNSAEHYKKLLRNVPNLSHVTVEINYSD